MVKTRKLLKITKANSKLTSYTGEILKVVSPKKKNTKIK